MNSRVEPKFRDVDDARGKLVSLTSGAGFRLLVKQALAPGEPLQINIGDGNLLVLSRYRLPVELGHSFGAEGIAEGMGGWQPGDPAASLEESSEKHVSVAAVQPEFKDAPVQLPAAAVTSRGAVKNKGKDRRLLVLGAIAAAVGSVLGIFLGGPRVDHAMAAAPAFVKRNAEPRAVATREPQPAGHAGSNATSFPDKKNAPVVPTPVSIVQAVPVPPVTRVTSLPQPASLAAPRSSAESVTTSAVPAHRPTATVNTGAELAHRISIKASSVSWVTACADGVAVFRKALNAGESAEIPFVQRASVHSGNAGAIELALGNQSIGPMGKWGEVRTIRATPASYEFVATTPARNCSDTNPNN